MSVSNLSKYSSSFITKVTNIISDRASSYFINIDIMFKDGTVVKIDPRDVTQFQLDQHYVIGYRDVIRLSIEFTAAQIKLISKYRQDLLANISVVLRFNDSTTDPVLVLRETYNLILTDQTDLDLLLGQRSFCEIQKGEEEHKVPMAFEAIPERDYQMRKERFNFILDDVTMEETMMAIAQVLKFKEVFIVPPDNTKRYKNMIIPALIGIEDVFVYLQESEGYDGVYSTGLNYYVQNNVLYIYPKLKPTTGKQLAKIYNVGSNVFPSAKRLFTFTGNDIEIAIVDPVKIVDLSQASIENIGTWYNISKPKKVVDQITKLTSSGDIILHDGILEQVAIHDPTLGVKSSSFTQTFRITNNTYTASSELYNNGIANLGALWRHACPYLLRPDLEYHFLTDSFENNGIRDVRCILASASYQFSPVNLAEGVVFDCVANLVFHLNKFL